MLVILRENVTNLGRIGDLVKVSDGYARNFLIPKNMVVAADEKNVAKIEHYKRQLEKKRLAAKAAAQELVGKLAQVKLNVGKKVGENDKIFGSVSTSEIAQLLQKAGYSVDRRMIEIPNPIRALGNHTVNVSLEQEVTATVTVTVVKQD